MNTSYFRVVIKLLLIFSVFAGSFGVAQAACNAAGTQCSGNVSVVYFDGNGNLNIRLDGVDIPVESTCTGSANYGQVPSDADKLKEFYALVLTAYALDNPLTLRMVGSSPTCAVSYMFMAK